MSPLLDPRHGDVEDDASSTKQRSLFAIAGGLLAEISLPKLALAWIILIVLPGILLGLAPLIATGWLAALSKKIVSLYGGIWPLLLLLLLVGLGWLGGRPVFRAAERGFWSLNSLAVQPGYAIFREGFRHLAELCCDPGLTLQAALGCGLPPPRSPESFCAALRCYSCGLHGRCLAGLAMSPT